MVRLSQQVRVQLTNAESAGSYVSGATGHDHQGRLLLATATSYGAVLIWDVASEKVVNVIATDAGETCVAMARDVGGRPSLAAVSTRQWSPLIKVWDAYEGRLRFAVDGHGASIVAFGSDERGRLLVAGGGPRDGRIRVWDAETGQLRRTLAGHDGKRGVPMVAPSGALVEFGSLPRVGALAFPPGGGLLASGGEDGVRLWDPDDGRALGFWPVDAGGVESLAFGTPRQGSLQLAAGCSDGLIRIWAAESGRLIHTLDGHGVHLVHVAFGEDAGGRLLLGAAGRDGTLRTWDAENGRSLQIVGPRINPRLGTLNGTLLPYSLTLLSSWALAFGVTADRRLLLASADGDGTARVYDPLTGELRHTLVASVPSARAVALGLSGSGRLLLVVGDDTGLLSRFDALTGEPMGTIDNGEWTADRLVVGVDDRGRTVLASSSFSGTIAVWDLDTGDRRWQLQGDDLGFWTQVAMGHGRDGALFLASTGRDATLRIRDLRRGRELQHEVRTVLVWSLAIGPGADGRPVVVTGDADGVVRVQDPVDLALRQVLTGLDRRVASVAIESDESGRVLVAAGDVDGRVLVWALPSDASGRPAAICRGHTGEVRSLTFSAAGDGRVHLVTVATDRTLRLWDPTTGAEVEVHQLAGAPYSVAAGTSADGSPLLAVALVTGEVTVWRWGS